MNSNICTGFPQDHITNVSIFVGMESSEESLSSSPADRYVKIYLLMCTARGHSNHKAYEKIQNMSCGASYSKDWKQRIFNELLKFFLNLVKLVILTVINLFIFGIYDFFFLIYPPFELFYFPLFVHFVHCLQCILFLNFFFNIA